MDEDTRYLLDKVMDLLLDPICVVDEQGCFVFVSAACERLFGYSQEELTGRNMIDLVHPDDRERTLAAADDIMQGRPTINFQNRYVHKDGHIVHIMWSARWSENERLRLAVARDITALKHAERMQHALYRISQAAHAADSLQALCRLIHQILGELLPADGFYIALRDGAGDTLSFPYYVDEKQQSHDPELLLEGTPVAEVIRTGRPILKEKAINAGADCEVAAWLGVPLVSHKGVIGALVLKTGAADSHYSEEDRELMQYVSTQIATLIERKQAESRLHHMAHHDALTDLPNRTLFNDRFDVALKRARREDECLALLCLDLDGFKEINDSLGHLAGDQLLREVGQRLIECVRESDTIGRMGGDEFMVLLSNVRNSGDMQTIIDKIMAAFDRPFDLNGRPVRLSTSIGGALYPEQGMDMDALLRHADAGMYAMKRREARLEEL